MRFFLTGFMGSGKSFWGQKIATKFNLRFIDLDEYISRKESSSISEIFTSKGEVYFREIETICLEEIITASTAFILATGGGTPCFNANMERMNANGITIYLKASPDLLLNHLQHEQSARPLISAFSKEEIFEFIKDSLPEREKFYSKAHHVLDTNTLNESIFEPIILNHV